MSPLRSDWSHAGLKGVIPSVLHYSLLGYNFFIPDAVGNNFLFCFFPYFWLFCRDFCSSCSGKRSMGGVFVLYDGLKLFVPGTQFSAVLT